MKFTTELCFIYMFYYLFKVVFCGIKTLPCPFTERLYGSNAAEFHLSFVNRGDIVIIPCCQKYSQHGTKKWFKKDRFIKEEKTDLSRQVWKITKKYELTFRYFTEKDSGAYYCTDVVNNGTKNVNYYYLIDIVVESPIIFGKATDYKEYVKNTLRPVKTYLDDYQNSPELLALYNQTGLTLDVDLRFDDWLPCDACKNEKKRIGHCHLIPHLLQDNLCKKQCKIYEYALQIDCRATWTLKEILPKLAEIGRTVPDFGRIIKCIGNCNETDSLKVIKHKPIKKYVLAGNTLQLICPDYSIRKKFRWEKNGTKLSPDIWDPTTAVSVNEFAILLINGAKAEHAGNYTCLLNEEWAVAYKVIVNEISSDADLWLRHMKYLSYIVLLCSIVLVAGVVIAIIERNSFQQIDIQNALDRYLKYKFDHEMIEPPSQT